MRGEPDPTCFGNFLLKHFQKKIRQSPLVSLNPTMNGSFRHIQCLMGTSPRSNFFHFHAGISGPIWEILHLALAYFTMHWYFFSRKSTINSSSGETSTRPSMTWTSMDSPSSDETRAVTLRSDPPTTPSDQTRTPWPASVT